MGVSWVFETLQSARAIELSFEQAGATLQGLPKSFKVDCTLYRPPTTIANQISNFYLLHHSYFPESSFIIGSPTATDGGLNRMPSRATADQGFELILSKFSSGLVAENSTRFELTGNEYHLKDFRLRVGTVSKGQASVVKGVIVEIEYSPSNVIFQCNALLQDLIETFFPGQTRCKPEIFLRHTHPDNYLAIDTLTQYLEIFLLMSKKA